MKAIILGACAFMTLAPLILTGIYYPSLPEQVPVFVSLMGEPKELAAKNLFTAFRLPLMGLILQGVCLFMYLGSRKNTGDNTKLAGLHRNLWLAASFFTAVKISFSSIQFTGVLPAQLIPAFRTGTITAAIAGLIFLHVMVILMIKEGREAMKAMMLPKEAFYGFAAIIMLVLYAAVVLLPKFMTV